MKGKLRASGSAHHLVMVVGHLVYVDTARRAHDQAVSRDGDENVLASATFRLHHGRQS